MADREEGAKDRLISPIDADASAGKKEHQSWAGYKGHMVIEEDSEIITAIETTPANTDDGSQLKPLLKPARRNADIIPQELCGDKGYDRGANLEYLESKDIKGYISLSGKMNIQGKDLFTVDDFTYDENKETFPVRRMQCSLPPLCDLP